MTQAVILKGLKLNFSDSEYKSIWDGRDDDHGNRKYGCDLLLSKDDEASLEKVKAAMVAAAEEVWPGEGKAKCKTLSAKLRVFLKDGDLNDKSDVPHGHWILSMNGRAKPKILLQDGRTEATRIQLWDGCFVNAKIEVWAQNHNKWGERINASVTAIVLARTGPAIGGSSAPVTSEDLDDLAEGTAVDDDSDDDIPF